MLQGDFTLDNSGEQTLTLEIPQLDDDPSTIRVTTGVFSDAARWCSWRRVSHLRSGKMQPQMCSGVRSTQKTAAVQSRSSCIRTDTFWSSDCCFHDAAVAPLWSVDVFGLMGGLLGGGEDGGGGVSVRIAGLEISQKPLLRATGKGFVGLGGRQRLATASRQARRLLGNNGWTPRQALWISLGMQPAIVWWASLWHAY